ncbi:MAG: hypothetical protein HYU63_05265 [Armatimonadetes bacterium]|nr:hypothetical protein [Armatimonadota bacterium]
MEFIISFLILFSRKKTEPFLRYHAYQSLFLGIVLSFIFLILIMFSFVFFLTTSTWANLFTSIFFIFILIILSLYLLASLGAILYCAYIASLGKVFKIPYLNIFLEKFFKISPEE